jgi:hypothetical protein
MDQFRPTDEQFAKIAPHLPTDTRGKARAGRAVIAAHIAPTRRFSQSPKVEFA